jgi:hypothetical protein
MGILVFLEGTTVLQKSLMETTRVCVRKARGCILVSYTLSKYYQFYYTIKFAVVVIRSSKLAMGLLSWSCVLTSV